MRRRRRRKRRRRRRRKEEEGGGGGGGERSIIITIRNIIIIIVVTMAGCSTATFIAIIQQHLCLLFANNTSIHNLPNMRSHPGHIIDTFAQRGGISCQFLQFSLELECSSECIGFDCRADGFGIDNTWRR